MTSTGRCLLLYRRLRKLPIAFPDAPQKFDGWVDVLPFEKHRVCISGLIVVDGEEGGREGKFTAAREKSFKRVKWVVIFYVW